MPLLAPGARAWAGWLVATLLIPHVAAGAELKPETAEAYDRHVAGIRQRFAAHASGPFWSEQAPEQTRARLRAGEVIAWPGAGDGILDVPGGLIHDWQAAAFLPGVSLEQVLDASHDYPRYSRIYSWIVGSGVFSYHHERNGDQYRVFLRLKESASVVTAVLDLWTIVDYHYPQPGRATGVSHSACIRQVEHAGERDEQRLPIGTGSGYLWRADTFSTYLERDNGVYVDFETVGLSRPFPRLLAWIIEPIARRLGRGSAAESLKQLRRAVIAPASVVPATPAVRIPAFWCTPNG